MIGLVCWMRRETMKRGKTVDEPHNVPSEKHRLLAQPSGKRSTLGEKHVHPCGEVPPKYTLLHTPVIYCAHINPLLIVVGVVSWKG
jgi:hypothetical protein